MKITDLKTYVVHCYRTNWVFVKIETDEGISGVGEATLEMKEKTVEAAVLELKGYLLGLDPREIERHFHVMYRDSYWRTGPVLMSALSAVEMALWDISAQELGVPVPAPKRPPAGSAARTSTNSTSQRPRSERMPRRFKSIRWPAVCSSVVRVLPAIQRRHVCCDRIKDVP